jgi:hypothetical protein
MWACVSIARIRWDFSTGFGLFTDATGLHELKEKITARAARIKCVDWNGNGGNRVSCIMIASYYSGY